MPDTTPVISVVVPAYNAARFLTPTLESVLTQTFAGWELIVVNDGSKDDTQAIAQAVANRDSRIRVFDQPNGGCGAARNFGLSQACADAEYIVFLDHDDIWEPTALQAMLRAAQSLPDGVGAVGMVCVMQDAQAKRTIEDTGKRAKQNASTAQAANTIEGARQADMPTPRSGAKLLTFAEMVAFNQIATMGQTLIRRSALAAAGPLDPKCGPVDDWDLYLRLSLRGAFATTDAPVIHWRSHEANTSKNRELMRRYEDYVRAKLLASPNLTDAQRQLATEGFQNAERNLAASQWKWAGESLAQGQVGEALKQTRRALLNYTRSRRGSHTQP